MLIIAPLITINFLLLLPLLQCRWRTMVTARKCGSFWVRSWPHRNNCTNANWNSTKDKGSIPDKALFDIICFPYLCAFMSIWPKFQSNRGKICWELSSRSNKYDKMNISNALFSKWCFRTQAFFLCTTYLNWYLL